MARLVRRYVFQCVTAFLPAAIASRWPGDRVSPRRAVRILRGGRLKMSARDTAQLLGLSHRRIQQLTTPRLNVKGEALTSTDAVPRCTLVASPDIATDLTPVLLPDKTKSRP